MFPTQNREPRQTARIARLNLLPVLLVATAWWLLTRPYQGIWHDGLFYAVQALRRLYPDQYAGDVFFLYGSQDNFTLFSVAQAWLTGLLGMDAASLSLTVAGAVLWTYALLRLLLRWLTALPLAACLILVLSADPHYGGFDVFSFGERFASPRLFSEAMVLLALSWWLEGRRLFAYAAVAGAALLHPLIALAGMGVFGWVLLRGHISRPLLLWLALLLAGVAGMQLLVWAGLSPRLDPPWRELIAQRSPFVFPYLWLWSDWLRLALDACLLWLASRYLAEESGKLAAWVLPVLALAALWALAAGVMGVQLAVAAQLLRVQWLAHLLALALAVPLCWNLWRTEEGWNRFLAIAVAGSLVFPLNLGGLVLPVLYGLYRWAVYRLPGKPPSGGLPLVLFMSVPLSGLALWLFYFVSDMILIGSIDGRPAWLMAFMEMPVALGVLFAGHALSKRLQVNSGWLWVYGTCVLAIGALYWDVRKPWSPVYDQPAREAAIAPVQATIPRDAVVYWESAVQVTPDNLARLDRGFERAWLWLRRSNYASFDQAAGNVFYRETAMETARRAAHLRRWGFRDGNLDWKARVRPPQKQPLNMVRLHGVCSDPVLDFVITDTRLPAAALSFEDPMTGRAFSVYDCRSLRQGDG